MREIKFRIWDKLCEKYTYPDKGYQGHFILDLNGRFYNLQNGSGGDDYVVQQYTELNDKNGKSIYEGDVLKLLDNKCNNPVGEVYFGSGAFHVRGVDCLWYGAKHGECEDYEIIGNIFETPELMKKDE